MKQKLLIISLLMNTLSLNIHAKTTFKDTRSSDVNMGNFIELTNDELPSTLPNYTTSIEMKLGETITIKPADDAIYCWHSPYTGGGAYVYGDDMLNWWTDDVKRDITVFDVKQQVRTGKVDVYPYTVVNYTLKANQSGDHTFKVYIHYRWTYGSDGITLLSTESTLSATYNIHVIDNTPISFKESNVRDICLANWDTNGDGTLTKEEASKVTNIGTAFKNNTSISSFEELQYFTGLTSIGVQAFQGCENLTSISLPNSVTKIERSAFRSCKKLASITIPKKVTDIGYEAFSYCGGLSSIIVENGNTVYDSRDNCNAIINSYRNELIFGCQNTVIPSTVLAIRNYAFAGCDGLTSIFIPKGTVRIENHVFDNCSGLKSLVVDSSNSKYDSRNNCNAIIETSYNTLIAGCQNTVVPNSVISIGSSAFSGRSGLTSITLPNSVTTIGSDAFGGCSGLTSITIPNSVTTIGSNAFQECSNLTSVILPSNISSINTQTFVNCTSLTSITIPEGVSTIEQQSFWGCRKLNSIELPNSITSIGKEAFYWCFDLASVISNMLVPCVFGERAFGYISKSCVLYVPAGTRDAYIAAGWTEDVFKGGVVEMTPTGVQDVTRESLPMSENCYFNIDGQRVANPTHGLYIINGKKVFIK